MKVTGYHGERGQNRKEFVNYFTSRSVASSVKFLEHQLSGIFMLGLLIWDPRCAPEKSDLVSVAPGSQSSHMKQLPVYSQLEVLLLK